MGDALSILLITVYGLVAVKVHQWFTISKLGFKMETPQPFLTHSHVYHMVEMILFVFAGISLALSPSIPWYLGGLCLGAVWSGALWIGYKLGFNAFRRVLREMIEDEENLKLADPAQHAELYGGADHVARRAQLEKDARSSDRELRERLKFSIRWGL